MRFTGRVLVGVGHVDGALVHYQTAAPPDGIVERPATGALDTRLRCPSCGRGFAVQICSLAEASRRRRAMLGLALLGLAGLAGAGLFSWFVAIRMDTAGLAILTALVGGLSLAAMFTLGLNAALYDGVHGPWTGATGTRHWLRPGTRDHRLATRQIP
jgi:hypothetical protein